MSEELKPCWVCGQPAKLAQYDKKYAYCPNNCRNHVHLPVDIWNTRAIEDQLRARAERAEGDNARLIAATPELLAACKRALDVFDIWAAEGTLSNSEAELAEIVRAAVIKAECVHSS